MLGLLDQLLLDEKMCLYVLVCSRDGLFLEELKKRDVSIWYIPYFRWMVRQPDNRFKWYFKKIVYRLLNIITFISSLIISIKVKKSNIEVVHTNSSVISIGCLISHMTATPHVFHIREFGKEDFNLYPIYNETKMFNYIDKHTSKVIAISKCLEKKYNTKFSDNKIRHIYNGVDLSYFINKKYYTKKIYSILLVGRIEEAKGQTEAIHALNYLKELGYNNLELIIIGQGDKSELESLITKYQLTNIKLLDYSPNLSELRENSDFELVCSKNEAFGRVTVEAMMSGNPVIGSNTGGTKELILDGRNGYLYRQGDYIDLSQKIMYFLNRPEEIKKMGEFASKYACENFNSDLNAQKIKQVYQEII